jgi:nitroreductase
MANEENESISIIKTPEEMLKASEEFYQYMSLRRSCRQFSMDPIPDDVIENVIRTAGTAPSGANKQPWLFCVVKNRELKHKIRKAAEAEEKKNYEERFNANLKHDLEPLKTDPVKKFLDIAPILIIVFKEKYTKIGDKIYPNYYVGESASIAVGFLMTALHNAGLATLCYTPSPMDFLNDLLDRPKSESPIAILPVGYPGKDYSCPKLPRKPLEEIIKYYV